MTTVAHKFAGVLDNAEGGVDGRRHNFRARFTGMTEASARQTCSAVRSHGMPCVASDGA